jgi:HlyD family secretion protein
VRNRRGLIAIIVLVVLAALVAGVFIFASANTHATVKVAKVTTEQLSVAVSASGKVSADEKSDIFPPTQGILSAVLVGDGARVRAGDSLATLDTDPLQIQAAQARAGIAAADAQSAQASDQFPSHADLAAANANVVATRYQYNLANSAYNAILSAYESAPATSQPSLEASLSAAKLQKLSAYAGYRQAVATRVKLSRTEGLEASQQAADAAATQNAKSLAYTQKQLDRSDMRSPIDGFVVYNALGAPAPDGTTPKAGPGAAVSPAAAPFTVYALDKTFFAAEVDETDIAKVRDGLSASVTLDAFPGDTFAGRVQRISPLAILTTSGGTAFPVYIPLDSVTRPVRIGMQGNTEINISQITGAVTIPIEALFDEGGKSYVYVVGTDSRLKKTEVVVGTVTDTRAQIKSGVAEGDTVALSGTIKLTDGLAITPQP